MANVVEIILKATDNASGTMNSLNSSFKSMTGFSLGAAGAVALAGKALQEMVQYTKEAIEKNDKYVTSIVDMARFTGDQVDQMSRLVQVADDAFLSQEALNNAMSIGAKKGIDMSVEGIKRLADEYNALGSVTEKNKLLNDNFGRSGLAMGKLLEQGSSGITKNMKAIADNLVVTDKSVKLTYDYKRSLDAVNDAMDGFSYSVAQVTIPALTDLNIILADIIENTNKTDKEIGSFGEYTVATLAAAAGVGSGFAVGIQAWADSIRQIKPNIEDFNRIALEHRGIVDGTGQSYEELSEEKMKALKEAAEKLTEAFKPLTAEFIYNQMATSLDEIGQRELARTLGLLDERAYSALGQMDSLTEKYDLNKDGVIDLTEQTDEYYKALKKVTDTAGVYTWEFIVKTNSIVAPAPPSATGGMTGYVQPTIQPVPRGVTNAYANGGSFVVPSRYGYEGFGMGGVATASAGETVTINKQGEAITKKDLENLARSMQPDYVQMARIFQEAVQRG